MTTLERLEKMEQEMKSLTQASVATVTGQQQSRDALLKLEQLLSSQLQQIHGFNQLMAQRQMALEQTLTSLAKTISCTVDELESANLVSGDSIMTRIRKLDENSERKRIEQMQQLQVIKEATTVTSESILILSQKVTEGDKEEVVSEFRVIELPSQLTSQEIKDMFIGKTVGETIEEHHGGQTLISRVEKVFELTQNSSVSLDSNEEQVTG